MVSSSGGSQLTALCAVASLLWLAHGLEGHQLIEQPRLSSLLILLISSIAAFATSFFATWLPGANGRFDDDLGGPLRATRTDAPKKPRRYFLPALVVCIVLRLELFHRVSYDLQCSSPGIEAFLPVVILAYEFLPGRRTRPGGDAALAEKGDDMWKTVSDIVGDWINESKASLAIGTLTLSVGTYLATTQNPTSTYFCSDTDRTSLVHLLQWIGLILDGVIAILLWRILAWARTTKSRLRTLGGILFVSSLCTGFLYYSFRLFRHSRPMSYHFRGLDSLYVFDVFVDSLAFSTFFVSTSLVIAEGTPLSLAGIVTFICGLLAAGQKTWLMGTWENMSPSTTHFGLILICVGFSFFAYANNLRSVVFLHRAFVISVLVIVAIAATIFTLIKGRQILDNHPLEKLIYDTRVESDRWLVHATVSNSLPIAVQEYRERHDGRDPPPKFDVWYKFATDRKSPILDRFDQMEEDLRPFWGISPEKIRADLGRVAEEPDIAMFRIEHGTPSHSLAESSPHKIVLDELVDMVKAFAEHLPDMELAINLNDRPRILAPWDDVHRFTAAGKHHGLRKLLSKRALPSGPSDTWPLSHPDGPFKPTAINTDPVERSFTSVRAFREMTALTCPPGTRARSGVHWNVRDLCASCTRPQSQPGGQFLTDWALSQELCHQPDLIQLHGFHMTSPDTKPLQELLPVFGRSKTDGYSDILIPLPRRPEENATDDDGREWDMRTRALFWRGQIDPSKFTHDLLRGGHQERLVHLVHNATYADRTTVLMPRTGAKDKKYTHEQLYTGELNALLPMDIGISEYTGCEGGDDEQRKGCEMAVHEFGPPATPASSTDALRHQYVLVIDSDDGPPDGPDFLRVLRSGSVPFLGSIFKEWYTERLMPWVHFVPVDLRYHALHSTLAYFTGIRREPRKRVNVGERGIQIEISREINMPARQEDGRWIAEQGRRWADKAIRTEDMQVYLFRLLLEWGRLINDRRDELGFVATASQGVV